MLEILRALSTSVLFVYICTITVPVAAFLPPRWIETKICLYRVEYDENGDAADARLLAETTLPHLLEGSVIFDDVPEMEGYFTIKNIDVDGNQSFSLLYIVEDEIADSRQFRCEGNYMIHASAPFYFNTGLWDIKGDEGYKKERALRMTAIMKEWKEGITAPPDSDKNESGRREWCFREDLLVRVFAQTQKSSSAFEGIIIW